MDKQLQQIAKKYINWCKDKDDGYIYDEVPNFLETLSRGDLLLIMNFIVFWKENQLTKARIEGAEGFVKFLARKYSDRAIINEPVDTYADTLREWLPEVEEYKKSLKEEL